MAARFWYAGMGRTGEMDANTVRQWIHGMKIVRPAEDE